jgi:hypothetical protein
MDCSTWPSQTDKAGLWNVRGRAVCRSDSRYPIGVTDDKFTISYNLFDSSTFASPAADVVVQKSGAGGCCCGRLLAINPLRLRKPGITFAWG